jgi:hypothetical protein
LTNVRAFISAPVQHAAVVGSAVVADVDIDELLGPAGLP